MNPTARLAVAVACAWAALPRGTAAEWALTGSLFAHDPTVLADNGTWACFYTGAGVPTKTSPNGLAWTQAQPLFAGELSWWRTYAPRMGQNDVWAPDLHRFNGRIWCYYAVSEFGQNNSAIGLRSCTSLTTGDWRDDGLVISSKSGTDAYNAIDPNLTIDAQGRPWLVFGSWFDGIQLVALDPGTMKPTGPVQRLAKRDGGIEAPVIVYANGYYHLFVSIGLCCQGVNSTYRIAFGRSRDIAGPYVDQAGVPLLNGGGSILESGGDRWKGPGGQDVHATATGWVIARHAYDATANGTPTLRIDDLYWDADGWPSFTGTPGPTIVQEPQSAAATAGAAVTLSVEAVGPDLSYQWRKGGTALSGATARTLTLAHPAAADAGLYSVVVTNTYGQATSQSATLTVQARPDQVLVPNGEGSAQILDLSTRGVVRTAENALIAGFVITGPVAKPLLILASGLNLRRLGLDGEIGRPHLKVMHHVSGQAVPVAENSDWQQDETRIATLIRQVGAQALTASTDPGHGDAGITLSLAEGVYSVVVEPAATSATPDGIGLIELYDIEPANGSRLVNISSRGRVETGNRQMIVGVVVGGGAARLLVRGVGPALHPLGIQNFVPNPSETLYRYVSGQQTPIANNDDAWNSAQADQITTLGAKFGAFALPEGSVDSALLLRLNPGIYSAIITSGDGTPGVALAEIYDTTDR
jgi:arabinan endo-1,5-alpha-L-arabinosidase